MFGGI
ncbi:hypothetical protein F383_31757 [Gossypium arboreum]